MGRSLNDIASTAKPKAETTKASETVKGEGASFVSKALKPVQGLGSIWAVGELGKSGAKLLENELEER